MYYPYFRGKQYELIAIRECADLMAGSNIIPIIEPVREKLSALEKCLKILVKGNSPFIIIINPKHGDFKNNPTKLIELLETNYKKYKNLYWGYIVDSKSNLVDVQSFLNGDAQNKKVLIHNDFPKGKDLTAIIRDEHNVKKHIFIDEAASRLYQRNFRSKSTESILIKDGFKKRKNKEHPEDEHFSELHLIYSEDSYNGFGDFLIVGDDYSDSGGPAYAVAIHLTYFDEEGDMRMLHFVSDNTESPVDPAGKFQEALNKLKIEFDDGSKISETNAVKEFLELHEKRHFPGLGYLKKLSMKHHLEIIANFLNSNG